MINIVSQSLKAMAQILSYKMLQVTFKCNTLLLSINPTHEVKHLHLSDETALADIISQHHSRYQILVLGGTHNSQSHIPFIEKNIEGKGQERREEDEEGEEEGVQLYRKEKERGNPQRASKELGEFMKEMLAKTQKKIVTYSLNSRMQQLTPKIALLQSKICSKETKLSKHQIHHEAAKLSHQETKLSSEMHLGDSSNSNSSHKSSSNGNKKFRKELKIERKELESLKMERERLRKELEGEEEEEGEEQEEQEGQEIQDEKEQGEKQGENQEEKEQREKEEEVRDHCEDLLNSSLVEN